MVVKKLTHKNAAPYAIIIDSNCADDNGKDNKFGIVLKEKSAGWRIGYLIVRDKAIRRLENHPDSFETFEPVTGKSIIVFAGNKSPERLEAFFLDKPIVVKKGIWHDVASVSIRAEIKIFENIEVKTEYYALKKPIKF